jgi:hypothetical protein
MAALNEERRLWQVGAFSCVMVSCCAGAELQVRQLVESLNRSPAEEIVLRELYPLKSDLYERAQELEAQYSIEPGASRA